MKYQPKITFLSTFILQLPLLFMSFSTLADSGVDYEIGIPKPMEAQYVKNGIGAVLSSDGERYYIVHESGVITKYQINPFKKLGETKFDKEKLIDFYKNKSIRNVLITSDEKTMFISVSHKLIQVDLQSGRVLREREYSGRIHRAIISGNDLVLFEMFGGEPDFSAELVILNMTTLALKKAYSSNFLGLRYGNGEDIYLDKYKGRIYLASFHNLVVLNSDTYRRELNISLGKPGKRTMKISRNHNTLYLQGVNKIVDYLNNVSGGKNVVLDNEGEMLLFDLKTRESKIESENNIPKETFDRLFLHTRSHTKNSLLVTYGSFSSGHIIDIAEWKKYRFYQYDSGESIIVECNIRGKECKNFQLTSGARKYLSMKNSVGKIVPINDATFTKYYRSKF